MKVPEKHRAIAHLAVDGAEIEWFSKAEECWKHKKHNHWNEDTEYRIKATPHSIDWSHVDARFIVLVGLPNGGAALATEKPEKLGDTWKYPLSADLINAEYFASFKRGTVDWKSSLVLRPMEAPKTLTKEQWAKIPVEFNFAAADYYGDWYAFITEPNRHTNCWKSKDDLFCLLEPGDVGTFPDVPWEDSLCQRPNE